VFEIHLFSLSLPWIVTLQLQEPCEKVLLFLYATSHPLQDLRKIRFGLLKGIQFL